MNKFQFIKKAVRFQHTSVQRITPLGKTYFYETSLDLPQQKVVDEIEAKFSIKDTLKWIKLNDIGIGRDGISLTMDDKWCLIDEVPFESIPSALQEVKKLVNFKEKDNKLQCCTCNIPIQSVNPKEEGYFKLPKLKSKVNNKNINELKDSEMALIDEFKVLAGVDSNYKSKVVEFDDMSKLKDLEMIKDTLKMKFQCERCKFISNEKEIQIREIDSIMKTIPKFKTIVYVCSFLDFPLGIESEVIKGRSNVIFLVNKSDVFYTKDIESQRLGIRYCEDLIEQYTGRRNSKVMLCSAEKGWNIEELIEEIKEDGEVYFIGRANTGKSSIINSILKKFYGKKHAIDSPPGIGSLPGYTRSNRKYKLTNDLIIIDTPGFTNELGVYKYLLDEYKSVNKYSKVNPNEVKKLFQPISSKFKKLFNGKSLLSYGGIFYLQPPKNAVIKVKYMFNKQSPNFEAKYQTMKRLQILNKERPIEIGKRFIVTSETLDDMVQYEIPEFVGNVDVVIQDFGVFSFQPTSSPSEVDGKFTIWAPRGVKMIVRNSIFKYIYRSKDKSIRRIEDCHLKELKIIESYPAL